MSNELAVGVRLDSLFPGSRTSGAPDVSVSGCTSNWQRVQTGDAFVCVLEDDADGHDLADRAVQLGAAAIIAERPLPIFRIPVYVVDDSRVALGQLCHELVGNPSREMRVIGVVGTQGKTTVAAILESILTAAGCDVGVLSGLKTYDGMTRGPGLSSPLTPMSLARRLSRMDAAGCSHAIVELSSHDLAQRRTAGVELDTVVVTCVQSQRLDLHQNVDNYRRAVHSVFDHVSPDGLAVINADDQVSCRWLATLDCASLTYGVKADAQITAEIVERNACETVFVLTAGCESAAIRTAIVGEHHVSNCLAAATVALAYGIELSTIARGIESVGSLPARMERIDCGQDFAVFVDAAENPVGLGAALRTARQLAKHRVICVLGAVGTTASEANVVRSVVQKLADVAIVTDDLVSVHNAWLDDSRDMDCVQVAADRGEAIAWALAAADRGDVVVIAGSRGTTGSDFGVTEIDEAEAAREMLYARSQTPLRLVG